jgi:opacity protein-like surface antigen
MTTHWKLAVAATLVAMSAPAAAAAPPDAKLWGGTWHLDAAASKWGGAGKEVSETRSYEITGTQLTMKSTATSASGKETNFTYSAACGGKVAPMEGNPNADSISLTCVSPREVRATSRLKGKVTVQSTATVSADGKRLTLRRKYVATKGAPSETLEFSR